MAVTDTPAFPSRLVRAWRAFTFRRHWPWLLLLLGVVGQLSPGSHGCLLTFGWLGLAILLFRGLAFAWRRLLFRVSRRLWVILALMSLLPFAGSVWVLTSMFRLGLGAQVSRSQQETLHVWQQALRQANREADDGAARVMLRTYGKVWVTRTATLPQGVKEGFVGMVWADAFDDGMQDLGKDVYLRAVRREGDHYRLLTLHSGAMGDRSQALVGGRVLYRLLTERSDDDEESIVEVNGQHPLVRGKAPLASWAKGEPLSGHFLFRPFRLPPAAFTLVDWSTGRTLSLVSEPETSLYALYAGYQFSEEQALADDTLRAIVKLVSVVVLLLVLQFVAALLGLRLSWSLGANVNALYSGVRRLAKGDLDARIQVRSEDQLGQLAEAFNDMASQLQSSMVERELRMQLEEELRVAREVQMRLLPDLDALHLPAHLSAAILPAKEVAGDWYDFHRLADGRVAFLIADVSGKGTSAAFYAAETKGMLAAMDKMKRGPVEVASRINEIWCATHGRRTFITLCYGVFDPGTGEYAFVRCGHPPAFLRHRDGSVARLQPKGIGIGMVATGFAERQEVAAGRLEAGDALVFFTDGLSEAQNAAGELYGEARIEACLAAAHGDPQVALLADVQTFLGDESLADDLTMVVLKA